MIRRRLLTESDIMAPCAWADPDECATAREREVAGTAEPIPDCPFHGAYSPEECEACHQVPGTTRIRRTPEGLAILCAACWADVQGTAQKDNRP